MVAAVSSATAHGNGAWSTARACGMLTARSYADVPRVRHGEEGTRTHAGYPSALGGLKRRSTTEWWFLSNQTSSRSVYNIRSRNINTKVCVNAS